MAVTNQTIVTGTRTTSNVNSDMRVRDVENVIALLEPYQTPIEDFFFSGTMPEEVVTHPRSKFEWFEDAFLPDTMTLVDAIGGGSTTEADIVVSGNYFLAGDTILIEATGELARVTAVDTANTEIDIKRVGGGNLSAAAAGTKEEILSLIRLTIFLSLIKEISLFNTPFLIASSTAFLTLSKSIS